jgi:hypothetical protein
MPDEVIGVLPDTAAAFALPLFPFPAHVLLLDDVQSRGFILRDASLRDAPQDEVLQTLMVRSAATARVSNHEARSMPDCGTPQPEIT